MSASTASQLLSIGSENDHTPFANLLTPMNNKESELLGDLIAALSNAANEDHGNKVAAMTLGKALKSDLKSQRLQREQNENSLSSTSSPVPTEAGDDLKTDMKTKEKSPKRKRPRRNPVWAYFEIRDNYAYCMEDGCKYNTGSVYSTNLKVHLKSHHLDKYNEVIAAELRNQVAQQVQAGQLYLTPAVMGTTFMIPSSRDQNLSNKITESHPTLGSMLQSKKPVVPQITEKPLANSPLLAAALKKPISPSSDESLNDRIKKRRRLRRHPVWTFFDDLDDKNIGCLQCDFKTSSGFTTNLKMHLKAHHRNDYVKVMQMECDQRKEEGCVDNAPQGKKKKRTAEELESHIEVYKAKHGSEIDSSIANFSPQMAFENLANLLSLSQHMNVDQDSFNSLDFDNISSPDDNPLGLTYASLKAELQDDKESLSPSETPIPSLQAEGDDCAPSLSPAYPPEDEQCSKFREFMIKLLEAAEINPQNQYMITQTKDVAISRFINEIGAHNISLITSNVFKQMLIAFDPTYRLDINHLKNLAEETDKKL